MSPYHRQAFNACIAKFEAEHQTLLSTEYRSAMETHYMQGVAAEQRRISEIEAVIEDRHCVGEARQLAESMKFDGKSTSGDLLQALGPAWSDGHTAAKAAGTLWDRIPGIREGFSSRESYVAFKRAEAEGLFRLNAPSRGLLSIGASSNHAV